MAAFFYCFSVFLLAARRGEPRLPTGAPKSSSELVSSSGAAASALRLAVAATTLGLPGLVIWPMQRSALPPWIPQPPWILEGPPCWILKSSKLRPQHLDRAPGVPQRLTTPQGCQAYPPKRGSYSSQVLGRPGEPAQARLIRRASRRARGVNKCNTCCE